MGQRFKCKNKTIKILEEIMKNCVNNKIELRTNDKLLKYFEPYKRQRVNMLNLPRSPKTDKKKMFQEKNR